MSAADANHGAADAAIRAAIRDATPLITTNLVLAEVHRLVLFRAGIRAATVAFDKITGSPAVTVTYVTAEHHRAARVWLDKLHDQVISLTDAVSFAVMDDHKCRHAITFDHDFWTAGFAPWQA